MGGVLLMAAVAKLSVVKELLLLLILSTAKFNGPASQASHPLFSVLPFIVLVQVASSLCPIPLLLHVLLLWPIHMQYLCIQQYPLHCAPPLRVSVGLLGHGEGW